MKLTALTAEEQDFASENHYVLERFLFNRKLEESEYYDVAVMGYLMAVKKWLARSDLHKWSFVTIAIYSMRSYVGNELKKQERRIQTISLDTEIPSCDGLTFLDTITAENTIYVHYITEENMNISYNVKIPENRKSFIKSDETIAIEGFLTSKMKNMCFEYDNLEEAKNRASAVHSYKKRHNHENLYDVFRIKNKIYVVRNGGK